MSEEKSAGDQADRGRVAMLVDGFKLAVASTLDKLQNQDALNKCFKDNTEIQKQLKKLVKEIQTGADAKFNAICQKHQVVEQLERLDELLSMPWNDHVFEGEAKDHNPSALDADEYVMNVDKYVQEKIAGDINSDILRDLQAQIAKLEAERDGLKDRLVRSYAAKKKLAADIEKKLKELNGTLDHVQQALDGWKASSASAFVELMTV